MFSMLRFTLRLNCQVTSNRICLLFFNGCAIEFVSRLNGCKFPYESDFIVYVVNLNIAFLLETKRIVFIFFVKLFQNKSTYLKYIMCI